MCDDRSNPALREGHEQRGCEHPRKGRERAEPGPVGQTRHQEPCAHGREGQREQPDEHDAQARVPEGERAEHGEHVREGIRDAEGTVTHVADAVARPPPERSDRVREGQQATAGKRRLSDERQSKTETEDRRDEQHPEPARADERVAFAFLVRERAELLALQAKRLLVFLGAHEQRLDDGPGLRPRLRELRPRAGSPRLAEGHARRGTELGEDTPRALPDEMPDAL
ncbi:hypothetical protein ACFPRL_11245 [Pseudoclavibacter helvolus]